LHVVEAGILVECPLGGTKSAFGKRVPARGLVGQFNSLADICKNNGMITDNIASPYGVHADLGGSALANHAFTTMHDVFRVIEFANFRENFSESARSAAWGVLF
jgi:hypothetical protein